MGRGTAATAPGPGVPGGGGLVDWRAAALAVARHPELWGTALRQASRLAGRGWWRRPPFVPVPDPGWARFRLQTMYGTDDHGAGSDDLVAWLRWCRAHQAARRRPPGRAPIPGAAGPPGVG